MPLSDARLQQYRHKTVMASSVWHITVPDQQEHTLSPSPSLAALYEEFWGVSKASVSTTLVNLNGIC